MRILILSDVHAGSLYAPWPEGCQRTDVSPPVDMPPTDVQRQLMACWQHMVTHTPRVDLLLVNGDVIDGENPKESGRYVCTPSPYDQAAAAAELLRPLRRKAKRMVLTRGTFYHEGPSSDAVKWLARELGAEGPLSYYYEDFCGWAVHASHHQTKGWIYAAGAAERTILFSLISEATQKFPRVDVVIRSHLHVLRVVHAYGKIGILTPAWKLVSPRAEATMEFARAHALSDIGAVLLERLERGRTVIDDQTYRYRVVEATRGSGPAEDR